MGKAEVLDAGVLGQFLFSQRPQRGQIVLLALAVLLLFRGGVQIQFPPGRAGVAGGTHGDGAVRARHGHDVLVVGDALSVGQAGQVAVLRGVPGVGIQLGPVQLKQQLFGLLVEPHPEADVQFLTHLFGDAEQAAGLDLAGVGVSKICKHAQLQPRPCSRTGHKAAQGAFHRKTAQGLGADALVQDAGGVPGRDHELVFGAVGLRRADAHDAVGAGEPEVPVRAAQRLQVGGGVQLQLRTLHPAVHVVALRPDQRHPAFQPGQQVQLAVVDADALVAACGQGACPFSHCRPPPGPRWRTPCCRSGSGTAIPCRNPLCAAMPASRGAKSTGCCSRPAWT